MKKCLFSKRVIKNDIKYESDLITKDLIYFNKMKHRAYALTVLEKDKNAIFDKTIHLMLKDEFNVNDYYRNSAIQEAKAKYNNTVENHKLHKNAVKSQISRIEKKIKDISKMISNKEKVLESLIKVHKVVVYNKTAKKAKKLPKFKTYQGAVEYLKDESTLTFAVRKRRKPDIEYNIYEFEVCYLKPMIKRLKHRLKMLNHRLDKTKIKLNNLENIKPTACFGSKGFFKKQHTSYKQNHELWKTKWNQIRNNNMTISGRKDAKGGNFVFKYDTTERTLTFTTMSNQEIVLHNIVFPYGQEYVDYATTATGEDRRAVAWSIEDKGDYFIIKCLVDLPKDESINYSKSDGLIAIDTNVDHIAWANLDSKGNLLDFGTIPFNLDGLSTEQASAVIEEVVIKVSGICVDKKKPLGMEDLDLKKSSKELLYNNPKLNQKLSSFAYAKITSAIESRCYKDKVGLFKRNPAFTSQIGKIKYMKHRGLSIHIAAACVIGRRCLGFKDKVPKNMKKFIPSTKIHNHHWSHWRQLSSKLKNIHPNNFYKEIDLNECETIKDYTKLLT